MGFNSGFKGLKRRGRQFSQLLAAEVCASAVVMLATPCSEVVWRVLATHSICQFPFTSSPVRHRVPSRFNWTLPLYAAQYPRTAQVSSTSRPKPEIRHDRGLFGAGRLDASMETVDIVQEAFESSEISATVNTWDEETRGEDTQARASILGNSKKTTCPGLTSLLNSRFTRVTLVCFIHKSCTLPSVALSVATTSNCTRQNLPDYISSTYKNSFYRYKKYSIQHTTTQRKKKPFPSSGGSTNHKIQMAKSITHTST